MVFMIENDLTTQKAALRAEALRTRGFLSLDSDEEKALCRYFFDSLSASDDSVIAAYWPKDRELDTQQLIDMCLDKGHKIALPVIDGDSRILKFAAFDHNMDLVKGRFGVCHPFIDDNTRWLEPDVFMVPMLAFDRKGYRLGFGGGYYDTTLAHYMNRKDILTVGLAYAKQACLFALPREEHDVQMDCIVTEQGVVKFS